MPEGMAGRAMRAAGGRTGWLIGGALALSAALAVDAWQTASPDIGQAAIDRPAAPASPRPRAASRATSAATSAAAETRRCTGFGPTPARTVASPAAWVTSDDYPADAIRRESQGTSVIRFRAGPDGRATDCTVTTSSGDPLLDGAACRLVTTRARYVPERDAAGCPVASAAKTIRFTWRLSNE